MRLSREQYMSALTRHNEASGSHYWTESAKRSGGGGVEPLTPLTVTGARASISAWLPLSADYNSDRGSSGGSGGGSFLPLLSRSADAVASYGYGSGPATAPQRFGGGGGGYTRGGVAAPAYHRAPSLLPAAPAALPRAASDGLADSAGGGRIELTSKASFYDLTQMSPLHPFGVHPNGTARASSPPQQQQQQQQQQNGTSASVAPNSFLVRKERISLSSQNPPPLPLPPAPQLLLLSKGTPAASAGRGSRAVADGLASTTPVGLSSPRTTPPPGVREDGQRRPSEYGSAVAAAAVAAATAAAAAAAAAASAAAAAASAANGPEMSGAFRDGDSRLQEGRQELTRDWLSRPPPLPPPLSVSGSREPDGPRSILKIPKNGPAGGGGCEPSNEQSLRTLPAEGGGIRIAAHTYFLTLSQVTGRGHRGSEASESVDDGERASTAPSFSRAVDGGERTTAAVSAGVRWSRPTGSRGSVSVAVAGRGPGKSSAGAIASIKKEGSAAATDRASSGGGSASSSSSTAAAAGGADLSPASSADRKRSVRFRDSLCELKEFLPWEPISADATAVSDGATRAVPVMRPYVL